MEDYRMNKSVRILFITHYAELLGANRSLLAILSKLQYNKKYILLVLLPSKGDMSDALDELGISYMICKYYPSFSERKKYICVIKGVIRELVNYFAVVILYFRLKNRLIDIIHTNSSVSNIGAYLSVFLKTKHIWHFREFVKQHYGIVYNLGEKYQLFMWNKCADRIIAVSDALREYYSTVLSSNKISTIYNGVDSCPSMYFHSRKENFIDIALVGLLHPKKHQDIVIRAISEVVHQFKRLNVHLHIWGNSIDGEYIRLLQDLVVENSLANFVTFYGYQKNVLSQMNFCHIGIVSSEYEAFGRVTIEYMLNGMTPIVSRSGANIEIVCDGVNGYLFELNDSKQLAQKIVMVIDNYSSLQNVRECAKLTAKQFTVEATVKKLLEIYEETLF